MRILVDEDSQARAQLKLLRADGHDVVAIGELDKNVRSGPIAPAGAVDSQRGGFSEGIIAVYRDADPRKNMNHAQIAAAIRRLESQRVTIAGEFQILNHWR